MRLIHMLIAIGIGIALFVANYQFGKLQRALQRKAEARDKDADKT